MKRSMHKCTHSASHTHKYENKHVQMYTLSQSHTRTWKQVSCDQYRFSTTKSSIVCYLYIRFVSSSAASHKTYLSMVQRGQQGMVAVQHSCQTRHVLHILLFLSHTVQYSCQTHTLHTSLSVTHCAAFMSDTYFTHFSFCHTHTSHTSLSHTVQYSCQTRHILLFLPHTVQYSCQTRHILHILLFLPHTVQYSCQTRHILHILLFLSHTVQYSCQTRHILHILLFLSHTQSSMKWITLQKQGTDNKNTLSIKSQHVPLFHINYTDKGVCHFISNPLTSNKTTTRDT